MMPRARRTDPETSHEAAAVASETTAAGQQAACLEAVKHYPGMTAAEIADVAGIDRYAASRRLPELRDGGFVHNGGARKCRIKGTNAMTWLPGRKSEQGELF